MTTKRKAPSTASKAAKILYDSGKGFIIPSAAEKRNILVALAKSGKVVYGRAYDIIKIKGKKIDLSDADDVEKHIDRILIYEIKSTNRDINKAFNNYFFALTTAELLVAQSLKDQFKFVFVNVKNKHTLELSLHDIFRRSKGIYPSWSISF